MSTQESIDKIYNEFERGFFESLERKHLYGRMIEPTIPENERIFLHYYFLVQKLSQRILIGKFSQ